MQSKLIEIEEQHKILLNILCQVDLFCRKFNLKYSLGGGTLLGAIRHKGFIPWDDDIDIMMPRPDFDYFKSHFDGVYPYMHSFDYVKSDRFEKQYSWLKVEDTRTIMIEDGLSSACYGINIDIFPIDGLPHNSKLQCMFVFLVNRLKEQLTLSTQKYDTNFNTKTYIKFLFSKLLGRKVIYKILHKQLTCIPFFKAKVAGALTGRYGMKEVYPREVFEHYIYKDFEKLQFMCIAEYDLYLQQHYGQYMNLPSDNEQISHGSKAFWK